MNNKLPQEPITNLLVEVNTFNDIFNYLLERPAKEVIGLIQSLNSSKGITNAQLQNLSSKSSAEVCKDDKALKEEANSKGV